jgi:hypothetical protein
MSTRSERAWRATLDDLDVLLDLTTDGFDAPAAVGGRTGTWSLRHGHGRDALRYERRRWRGRSSYGTGCPRADGDGRSAER